eukprot:TRINITY_DN1058_c0_g1_i1.p1 TRINITY_DN1058_c0_g1~~TRINITY_DN1058_c0_g1_i1.p1  ORF type:complete len:833 (+),score=386.88 TRINITY_DN1058_c0_g1_i1:50-2500(+)
MASLSSVAPAMEEMVGVVYGVLQQHSKTGRPTALEFEAVLQAHRVKFSSQTVSHLFTRADTDSDGELTQSEFAAWGDAYPRVLECMYFRVTDRWAMERHGETVAAAVNEREAVRLAYERSVDGVGRARRNADNAEADLRAQMADLERAREEEARRRSLDEAETQDGVTATQGAMIAEALDQVSAGVCAEKREQHYASVDAAQVKAFAERLAEEWRAKDGDIVDELVANLSAPDMARTGKVAVLAEAARHLEKTKSEHYPERNRIELLVLALYTMAGPDIDALMTYKEVPVYDEEQKHLWEQYCAKHGRERNGAIFSAINWAMRTAADPKQAGDEAWGTVRKWIKYLCLLLALCAQEEPSVAAAGGASLARGLAGLPASVFEAHQSMRTGDALHWPASSSCALDRSVSEAYIRGDAANATKQAGGGILFLITKAVSGVMLQPISKYPKESEMLLPPLSAFTVEAVRAESSLPGSPVIDLVFSGHGAGRDFVAEVLRASEQSATRIETALVQHAERALRETREGLEETRKAERRADGDVLRTSREVERQRDRVAASKEDAERAEARLRELEELLRAQRDECDRQRSATERCEQDLAAAREVSEDAQEKSRQARKQVADAEESVQRAEEQLTAVREVKRSKKQEAADRLSDAMELTRLGEVERERREGLLAAARDSEAAAAAEAQRLQAALDDADARLRALQQEGEEMGQRREAVDEQEQSMLEQEVRLVEQRLSLEHKERKLRTDVRSFGDVWRPPPPAVGGAAVPPPRRSSAAQQQQQQQQPEGWRDRLRAAAVSQLPPPRAPSTTPAQSPAARTAR